MAPVSDPEMAQDRLDRVIIAAADAFASLPPEGTDFKQIANSAQVDVSYLERHFKTLDGLWQVVAEKLLYEAGEALKSAMQTEEGQTPDGMLRSLIKALVSFNMQWPQYMPIMMLGERGTQKRFEWILNEFAGSVFSISTLLISAAQKQGLAKAGDPARLYYAVIGIVSTSMVHARQFHSLSKRDPFSKEERDAVARLAMEFLEVEAPR